MRITVLLALVFLTRFTLAETDTNAPTATPPALAPASPPKPAASAGGNGKSASSGKMSRSATAAQLQAALDQLTQSNRDLLDLLKKQQVVLEDMQYDRRLESRQIQSLEERLTTTLFENTQLQNKVASLEAAAEARPQAGTATAAPLPATADTNNAAPNSPAPAPVAQAPPLPATYLPPADTEGAPGTKSWHRLFTLKGEEGRQTDLFHVDGRTWRVLWHNQDKPGKTFENTSALFINAFPKDDTIPQKVCSKLGSGGDSAELEGPGNYYLKIEASGGSWELAVEDFR
jgi:hypothetical protein